MTKTRQKLDLKIREKDVTVQHETCWEKIVKLIGQTYRLLV